MTGMPFLHTPYSDPYAMQSTREDGLSVFTKGCLRAGRGCLTNQPCAAGPEGWMRKSWFVRRQQFRQLYYCTRPAE